MANQRPQSPVPWLWLAEAHTVLKDKEAAVQSARRALAQAPNDMEVQRKTVEYELATGRVKEALAIARAAQVQRQGSAFGHSLEGDIHASGKQWDTAAKAYKAALDRQQATVVAEKLHLALLSAGKRAEADAMAADWVGRHANDAHFLFFLANLSLSRQDLPAAEERLAQVVKVNPENAAAHNLLAWVMLNLKKPRAAEHAALANKLRPNDPAFMDVWASSLAMEGKVRDAIEIQKKSVDLQPANALLRLNLAKLYAQGGDKAMARKELQTLAQLGDKFPMQNEVKRLQESL
jgi:predicted Zn-dependent protease